MASAAILGAGSMIALYDFLSSQGQNLSITDNVTTSMSINSNFESDTKCYSSITGSQTMVIQPGNDYKPAAHLQDDNSSCSLCNAALESITQLRSTLEEDAVTQSNYRYQAQTASEETQILMKGSSGTSQGSQSQIGACDLMCFDVVVFSVQQSQVFNAETSCEVDSSVTNNLSQSISGKIKASLKNQEDIIGQLEDAFTSNLESITNSLSSNMNQTLNQVVRQQLFNNANSVQVFNVGIENSSGGERAHSVYVNNVTQSYTANSIANLVVNNQVNNSLRQSADYSIAQQLLSKNDTIGDVTRDFTHVIDTMGQFLDTLTGDVLILIGVLIALFLIIVFSLYFFTKRGRELVNNLADNTIQQHTKGKDETLSKK